MSLVCHISARLNEHIPLKQGLRRGDFEDHKPFQQKTSAPSGRMLGVVISDTQGVALGYENIGLAGRYWRVSIILQISEVCPRL